MRKNKSQEIDRERHEILDHWQDCMEGWRAALDHRQALMAAVADILAVMEDEDDPCYSPRLIRAIIQADKVLGKCLSDTFCGQAPTAAEREAARSGE